MLSPDGRDGSLRVFQDMTLTRWALPRGWSYSLPIAPGRRMWLQVIAGALTVNDINVTTGDSLAVEDESRIALAVHDDSEVLLFDLSPV
ncbi:Quercetin 2,3-dioxygenase [Sodalis glossinidius str. 'morsitans']|uniref:Quercetin 2,3-dioxygenase n=1 Tax=Sodalis glossinidius (strain morsitans) TaxID=343509 RepID=A0A193QNE1_SODGM|nr:Quercetin 2,3-dioxygenase [Sodalis glossinidius str. 'morsitans']